MIELSKNFHVTPEHVSGIKLLCKSFKPNGFNNTVRYHFWELSVYLCNSKAHVLTFRAAGHSFLNGEPDDPDSLEKAGRDAARERDRMLKKLSGAPAGCRPGRKTES